MYNALGGITWAVVFGLAGYVFGKNIGFLEEGIRDIGWGALAVFAVSLAIIFAMGKKRAAPEKRRQNRSLFIFLLLPLFHHTYIILDKQLVCHVDNIGTALAVFFQEEGLFL